MQSGEGMVGPKTGGEPTIVALGERPRGRMCPMARPRDFGAPFPANGSPSPRNGERLRFVAQGGLHGRLRAATARPFLAGVSYALSPVVRHATLGVGHSAERVAARLAEHLADVRMDVSGLDRVEPDERYVVVSLHEGMADVLAMLRLPIGLRFAVRDELFAWPGIGRYLLAAGHVRVDSITSVHSVRRFYREAERVFDEGDSLVLFAQGSILGIEVAFRSGAARLARRFGRPLLPVVVTGSHRVWEHPYSPTLRFGQPISMRVLDPISPADVDDRSFRALEERMKHRALSTDMAPARRYRPEADGWWDGYEFEVDPAFPRLQSRVAAHRAQFTGEP